VLTLSVDTCFRAGGVAALQNGAVVASVFARSEEPYSSRLFKDLQILSADTGLSPSAFDLYAVAHGPGSFTGTRVGIAAAKAWSELYGKPIVAVSTLEAVAAQHYHADGITCSVLDAHRGQLFAGIYWSTAGPSPEPFFEGVVSPAELVAELRSRVEGASIRFASPCPEIVRLSLSNSDYADMRIEAVSDDLAPWVGKIAFARAQRGETSDALTLDANYIRRCDAEVYWKGV
jgi:tRNA threonylcarbamoyladenosine biosynthesis protein TsaB